ncbi:MAG: hypothetical protein WBZ36_14095 [Candidatus Nitrosopolaris sp.]
MPSRKVEITEYECAKCSYKWINRINGPKPKRCSKCKRWDWEEGYLSRNEKQLRLDLLRIEDNKIKYPTMFGDTGFCSIPTDICDTFLGIFPRLTEEELRNVLNPMCYLGPYSHRYSALSHKGTCSDQIYCCPGWIPIPDKPGSYDFDWNIHHDMVRKEKDVRHKLMQHIIDSRKGIMNTNSTHYQYFEYKKHMAKLSELGGVSDCDDEEGRSDMVDPDGLSN